MRAIGGPRHSARVRRRYGNNSCWLLDDVAPGILENVMNKTLLSAYESTPIAAFDLCSIGTVSDFKEISRYRLLGTVASKRSLQMVN